MERKLNSRYLIHQIYEKQLKRSEHRSENLLYFSPGEYLTLLGISALLCSLIWKSREPQTSFRLSASISEPLPEDIPSS